ncbi:hypothetical protein P3W85_03610 [Cupriavidus basilensis]|uniref:Uncharacterized protein n=1 Tax=Cupriavidus basilensis TaxID=68895 RepID=A0ABT6AHF7_9BURK|nr:hypothetical protein [Cupriavidus basilensis]MDF3832043.1 hypothetical protein [Cupriavidus basilensis]
MIALSATLAMTFFRGVRNEPGDLGLEDAVRYACYEAIDRMSPTPYAVDFEIDEAPPALRRKTDGTIELQLRFTAKNAHDASTSAIAYCSVSGDGQRVERISLRRTP